MCPPRASLSEPAGLNVPGPPVVDAGVDTSLGRCVNTPASRKPPNSATMTPATTYDLGSTVHAMTLHTGPVIPVELLTFTIE